MCYMTQILCSLYVYGGAARRGLTPHTSICIQKYVYTSTSHIHITKKYILMIQIRSSQFMDVQDILKRLVGSLKL